MFTFFIKYAIYCIIILTLFLTLSLMFTLLRQRDDQKGLDVYLDGERTDAYGNRLKTRKYIKYKGNRYYIGEDVRVFRIFDDAYVMIDNKRIRIFM